MHSRVQGARFYLSMASADGFTMVALPAKFEWIWDTFTLYGVLKIRFFSVSVTYFELFRYFHADFKNPFIIK
jgi:hypothetical protein